MRGRRQLVERLLINDGELLLGDWDDLGARRKRWSAACGAAFMPRAMTGRCFCTGVNSPPARAIAAEEAQGARERLFPMTRPSMACSISRGLLHSAQPIGFFMHDVMRARTGPAMQIARRHLQASFGTRHRRQW